LLVPAKKPALVAGFFMPCVYLVDTDRSDAAVVVVGADRWSALGSSCARCRQWRHAWSEGPNAISDCSYRFRRLARFKSIGTTGVAVPMMVSRCGCSGRACNPVKSINQ